MKKSFLILSFLLCAAFVFPQDFQTEAEAYLLAHGYTKTTPKETNLFILSQQVSKEIIKEDSAKLKRTNILTVNVACEFGNLAFRLIEYVDYPEYPPLLSFTLLDTPDGTYIFYKINYNLEFVELNLKNSEQETYKKKIFY